MRSRLMVSVAVGAALTAACSGTPADPAAGDSGTPSSLPSAATAVPDQPPLRLPDLEELPSTSLLVHGAPAALTTSPGTLWVQQHRGDELTRVDAERGRILDTVNVGRLGCGDLLWAAGSVWQTGCGMTPGLVRIDGETTEVTDTLDLGGLGAAYLDGEIWSATFEGAVAELRRIDAAQVDEGHPVPVPGLLLDGGVVTAAGSIWVGDESAALVYQVDPTAEEVVAVIPMPVPPDKGNMIEHDGAAWYVDMSLGVLVRVDPLDGSTRLLKVRLGRPSEYRGLAASTALGAPGRLWVRSGDEEVWLVDTRHDQVMRRIAVLDGGGGDVQQIGDSLWVSSFATNEVQRISLAND